MPNGLTRNLALTALFCAEMPDPVTCSECGTEVEATPVGEPFAGKQAYRWDYCDCMNAARAVYDRLQAQERDTTQEDARRRDFQYTQRQEYDLLFPQFRRSRKAQRQTVATFTEKPDNRALRARVTEWLARDPDYGLFFTGPPGTGKTHLARAIVHEYQRRHRHTIYASIPYLLERLQPNQRPDAPRMDDILEAVTRADLVVWDDLGAEKPTEWTRVRLYLLVDARYEAEKPIVVTSNWGLDRLKQQEDARIMSRILEMTQVHELAGADERIQRAMDRMGFKGEQS